MALTDQRKGEIALILVKHKVKEQGKIPSINSLKRDLGNHAKELGISKEEALEFITCLAEELMGEFISELKKMNKTGVSE
jgi:hypothetical protein